MLYINLLNWLLRRILRILQLSNIVQHLIPSQFAKKKCTLWADGANFVILELQTITLCEYRHTTGLVQWILCWGTIKNKYKAAVTVFSLLQEQHLRLYGRRSSQNIWGCGCTEQRESVSGEFNVRARWVSIMKNGLTEFYPRHPTSLMSVFFFLPEIRYNIQPCNSVIKCDRTKQEHM